MYWVLQDRFFDPHAFAELRRQLDAQDTPHAVVRVDMRTLQPAPPVAVDGPVFVCGSSAPGRVAHARGWSPGYVDEDLDHRLLVRHYGEHLLNADATFVALDAAPMPSSAVFVRPVGDGKQFAGCVMSPADFATLDGRARGAQLRLRADDLIVMGRPRIIHAECRLRVVDGAIGSSAFYAGDIGRFVAAINAMAPDGG